MFRRFSTNFALVSIAFDAAVVALGLVLAARLRPAFNPLQAVADLSEPVSVPIELFIIFPMVWVLVNLLFSVYDGRRNLKVIDEYGSLTLAAVLAGVTMAGVLYLTYRDISRFMFILFVALAFILMLLWRAGVRILFRMRWLGPVQQRRILILGAGVIGRRLANHINEEIDLGMELVGFLDDDPAKVNGQPDVLGNLDRARAVIQHQGVDDVVMALPLSAHARLNQVVSELHDLPVRVWIIPDYFSLTLHRASVEEFAGIPMLDLRAPALSEYQRMIKRAFDFFVVIVTLPVTLLLMGLISLAVWLDSRGPVFYVARRVGENGRIFSMYKFRSMVVNAEALQDKVGIKNGYGEQVHKVRNDPRVTRVGRILRRTSLDELPQLINVLAGTMSLVGPRPEMPNLVEKYAPWQRKRFTVPQGITGWWQINGRSDRPMHLHTEDDLYYVQHYSLWLDLQILLRTAWSVVRGKGAF
ncbi:MAG TPA: sugar transferase [Bellilinea sp.]|nr:sugar transferase [Bellilinea sp.]